MIRKSKTIFLLLASIITVLLAGTAFGLVSTVSLFSPGNDTWSSQGAVAATINFTFNYTGNTTSASCELLIDGAGYGINAAALNNTNALIPNNATISEGTRYWNITCTDSYSSALTSATRILKVDRTPPNITFLGLADPDFFYSSYQGNDIIHLRVNATEPGGISSIIANFSNITTNCPNEAVPLAYNATTGFYEGVCDRSEEHTSELQSH